MTAAALHNKKFFLGTAAVLMTGLSIYYALQLRFEEDISKIIPAEKNFSVFSSIFSNPAISDRLAVTIALADTSAPADPAKLIDYAKDLVGELESRNLSAYIKEIHASVDEKNFDETITTFYNNLPLFLLPQDYALIDTAIAEQNVKAALGKNYNVLVSPASIVLKKYLVRDPLGLTYIVLNKLRSSQFADEYQIVDGSIFTKDRKNLLIFITSKNPSSQTDKNAAFIDSLDLCIKALDTKYNGAIDTQYFGGIAVAAANASRIKQDVVITVLLSVVLLVVFITYFVKVRWAAFLTFLPAVFGALVALALLYFLKGTVSSISLGLGSILLGVGVDYALYIFSYIKNETGKHDAVRQLAFPIALCALTSMAVFFCLLFVKTEALQDLGLFMAISLMGAAFFSVVFLPYLIRLSGANRDTDHGRSSGTFVDWFFEYRFDRSIPFIIAIVAASGVFYFTSAGVGFDGDMKKMNFMSPKLQRAEARFTTISNISMKSVYVVASGATLDEALQANDSVGAVIDRLQRQSIIKGGSALNGLLSSEANQRMKIDRWNAYWTPEKKSAVKELLRQEGSVYKFNPSAFNEFYRMLDKRYALLDTADVKKLTSLILSNYIIDNGSSVTIVNVLKVEDRQRDSIYAAFAGMHNVMVGDKQHLADRLIGVLKEDFTFLVDVSSIVVLLIMIISLGRIELGVIAFIPIKLAWMWTVGIMGVFGMQFSIFNIIISTLIFSTGVDYCILIMRSLQQEYASGIRNLPTAKYGIFLSSGTTVIGIGVLLLAQHPAMHSVAVLPIVGYLSVVVLTFSIEPVMISWLMLKRKERGEYPVTLIRTLWTIFAYVYFISGCLLLTVLGFIIAKLRIGSDASRRRLLHECMSVFCRSMIYVMVIIKKTVINDHGERFEKPAVIVCNHQSVLDILLVLMLSPKIILLTNDWVWNSPLFGKVVQYAQFYPISHGVEESIPKLQEKVNEGFSIVVFPEGSRSSDSRIHRFHKGAFFIAEKLNLDVLPIIFHGTGDTIKKGEHWVRNGALTVKIMPRIPLADASYGSTYSERSKAICRFFRREFDAMKQEIETPAYFRDQLVQNYIYKQTTLETYLRIKLRLEDNFAPIVELVPRNAVVTDIGCGYGFMSYMLAMTSAGRTITGIDHDKKKIDMANNCFSKNSRINFVAANIMETALPASDVFILYDVLHYLRRDEQEALLTNCAGMLAEGGSILIRDANTSLHEKHRGTRLTEFFSIGLGFNESSNKELCYMSEEFLAGIAGVHGLQMQIVRKGTYTSNQLVCLKKNTV